MYNCPSVLCVPIQSAADDFKSHLVFITSNGVVAAYYGCQSDSELYWILAQLLYIYGLNAVLVVLAIKSRKINHPNFKDTKKVIALVLVTFGDMLLDFSLLHCIGNYKCSPYLQLLFTLHLSSFLHLRVPVFLVCTQDFPSTQEKADENGINTRDSI